MRPVPAQPAILIAMSDPWAKSVIFGTLRRKKQKHGILEDPWKTLCMCWVENRMLVVQGAEIMIVRQGQDLINKVNVSGPQESFSLDEWLLSGDAKDRKATKFTFVNKTDASKLSFKAETVEDLERWINALNKVLESEPPEPSPAAHDNAGNGDESDSELTFRLDGYHNFFYQNGDKYEGEWKAGKKHGLGRYIRADGTVYQVEIHRSRPPHSARFAARTAKPRRTLARARAEISRARARGPGRVSRRLQARARNVQVGQRELLRRQVRRRPAVRRRRAATVRRDGCGPKTCGLNCFGVRGRARARARILRARNAQRGACRHARDVRRRDSNRGTRGGGGRFSPVFSLPARRHFRAGARSAARAARLWRVARADSAGTGRGRYSSPSPKPLPQSSAPDLSVSRHGPAAGSTGRSNR